MIRLWNRAGLYRSLGALVLVGGIAGGVAVAADGPARQPANANNAANSGPLNVADLERQDAERAETERAARDDAQRKADEAAVAAAEQAKKTPSASASSSKGPTRPSVPIPTSCNVYSGNRAKGCALTLAAGFDLQQMGCLEKLWSKESGWNERARNPSSGAYGIAQALPPGKMSSAGSDYMTNPETQIRWGLSYIKGRYGTPCAAWNHSQDTGWY